MDEETRFWFALVADHPEWRERVLDEVRRYKGIDTPDTTRILDAYLEILACVKVQYDELDGNFHASVECDVLRREMVKENMEKRVADAIAFFQPSFRTSPHTRLLVQPWSAFQRKTEGRGVVLGDTVVVLSHVDNPENLLHEYLHAIINPIVEKPFLTKEEEQNILTLARADLIEHYKEPQSILNEVLLRAYISFAEGKLPPTAEEFTGMVMKMSEEQFAEGQRDSQTVRKLASLGVTSLAELQSKSTLFFERFVRDALQERVPTLYGGYVAAKEADPHVMLEQYLLGHKHDVLLPLPA